MTNNDALPLIKDITAKSKTFVSHDSFDIKYAQNQILEDQGYSVIKDIGSGTFASVKVQFQICQRNRISYLSSYFILFLANR